MTDNQTLNFQSNNDKAKADEIWAIVEEKSKNQDLELVLGNKTQNLLNKLVTHSPYLRTCITRFPGFLCDLCLLPESEVIPSFWNEFADDAGTCVNKDELSKVLRDYKAKLSLLLAVYDISETWPLEKITRALSDFAGKALNIALNKILEEEIRRSNIEIKIDTNGTLAEACGLFILGMGKLGAGELNYSSDIDLIVLYEPDCIRYNGRKNVSHFAVKLTQDLIELIEKRTAHGYVFRTDLRLRPDPGSTPLAMTVAAAETYYQTVAANWERSAMIKASIVAGDRGLGTQYLANLSSWIWRRSMDFAAISDIASIKTHINLQHDQVGKTFEGFDVKLGRGGIREIEFFCQINQLLYGGRHPEVRVSSTLSALKALAKAELLDIETVEKLSEAYTFLRTLEHRIQMVRDEQTHTIPEEPSELENLALFANFDSSSDLEKKLIIHTSYVADVFDNLMPNEHGQERDGYSASAIESRFKELGYRGPDNMAHIVRKWRKSVYRALRTDRSQRLLEECLPELIQAFSTMNNPDAAMSRFDQFLSQLPAGIQLFALLNANPNLFALLARIMGLAPALADTLSKKPTLWEMVLEPGFYSPIEPSHDLRSLLSNLLKRAKDYQDVLDLTRQFTDEYRFRIGVQLVENLSTAEESMKSLARLADCVLMELVPKVEEEFERRYGNFDDGAIAIVALGKYGGGELTLTSDLDLVFLYNAPQKQSYSDGRKRLSPSQYYSRLGQNILTAISALTPKGVLFEVDTRLRPSGNQGPLVVTLETFSDYYRESAWTWEHMALTRSRVIYAPNEVARYIEDTISGVLTRNRDIAALATTVIEMRDKLAAASGTVSCWDLKEVRGGLIDIEFICQYLALKHGASSPDIFTPNINEGLIRLRDIDAISQQDAETLSNAHILMQKLQSIIRLCFGAEKPNEDDFSSSFKDAACRVCGIDKFETLKETLLANQQAVLTVFDKTIGV